MTRNEVYDLISEDRDHQTAKWGSVQDRPHEVGGWILLIQEYVNRAAIAWCSQPNDAEALSNIRKAVALGVAAMEQHAGEQSS